MKNKFPKCPSFRLPKVIISGMGSSFMDNDSQLDEDRDPHRLNQHVQVCQFNNFLRAINIILILFH